MKHKLNTDRMSMRDISNHYIMQVATRFERRQNKLTPKMITLYCRNYKCTMYIKLLNAVII